MASCSFRLRHGEQRSSDRPSDEAGGLEASITLALDCQVMLRTNSWVDAGLANGTRGILDDIHWNEECDPKTTLPASVFVRVCSDDYIGPTYCNPRTGHEVVVLGPTTAEWSDGETCTRRQIPIVPAAASTINKAQGITAKQVVTDISGDLKDPALAYVAVSRAKSLDGVLLEKGFDFERLQYEETNARKARQIRLRTP
jgi:ATP-dependent exoDNAse (exonuclease V) alpha subunit